MHPRIAINTLCLPPAPLGTQADRVALIGAGAISPQVDEVIAFGITESAAALRSIGIAVATVTHRAFGYASEDEMRTARERLLKTIDLAAAIGAETIIMTTGGRGALPWPEAAARFAAAMAPCAEAAIAAGIGLGIEPTSHLYADVSIAHRLTDAAALARSAGIGVMIDLFACWVDADIETAIAQVAPLTRLIQVSDYVYGDRGLPCRAVPGDGAIPLGRLIPAIERAGFAGRYDLEIIGPRLAAEGIDQGLRRAAGHIAALLEHA